jgi:alcohol dehydrogenase class IV
MAGKETFQDAFTEPPGTNLAGIPIRGLVLPSPYVSWGVPYYESCADHVRDTFHASKVYIMASASLSKNTDRVDKLKDALRQSGAEVVGVGTGIKPHSPWSQTLKMAAECRAGGADCVVTLGAGSTTDAAKVLVLVRQRGSPAHNLR